MAVGVEGHVGLDTLDVDDPIAVAVEVVEELRGDLLVGRLADVVGGGDRVGDGCR